MKRRRRSWMAPARRAVGFCPTLFSANGTAYASTAVLARGRGPRPCRKDRSGRRGRLDELESVSMPSTVAATAGRADRRCDCRGQLCQGAGAGGGQAVHGAEPSGGHAHPRLVSDVAFPYLLLLVSGGHCQTLLVEGVQYRRLGTTIDDAIGEAFDKTAKLMELGQPGGPAIEALAAKGDHVPPLPVPFKGRPAGFSGSKTAVRRRCRAMTGIGPKISPRASSGLLGRW